MIEGINKFPIVILSSSRSGSTVLLEILSKQYPKLQVFSEPDSPRKKVGARDSMENFTNYSNSNNQYIVKCHLNHLNSYPSNFIKKVIENEGFLIKIRRKNVLDQMVSYYIELIRWRWYYDAISAQQHQEEIIPIKSDIIEKTIKNINKYNEQPEWSHINYDLEIYYEDFIKEIPSNLHIVSTPKPINHNEIYQAIKTELEKG
jgi:LPS sulfotransferase NodH